MKPLDTSEIREAVRETAVELYNEGITGPSHFLHRFEQNHEGMLSQDVLEYGCGQWIIELGRKASKRVGKEAEAINGHQLILPISMSDLDIPDTLQVPRDGTPAWVAIWDAGIEDGDAYEKVLEGNVNACIARLTDFVEFWKTVRPILEENPDWKVGDAIKWLRDQEREAG